MGSIGSRENPRFHFEHNHMYHQLNMSYPAVYNNGHDAAVAGEIVAIGYRMLMAIHPIGEYQ